MKAKSKLLILLLTLALLCGILFVSVSAAGTTGTATEPTTGFGVTVNGETTHHTENDYNTLYTYVKDMPVAAKITLYQDYTVDAGNVLTFKKAGTELDLNGHIITATSKFGFGFILSNTGADTDGLYVYSSKAGAQILATKDGGFIFGAGDFKDWDGTRFLNNAGTLTIGKDKSGRTYPKNLTVKGTCLLSAVNDTVIDGIVYENSRQDNAGAIQCQLEAATVTVNNCDFYIYSNRVFAGRYGSGWKVDVASSRIYTHRELAHSDQVTTANSGIVTMTDTDIYSLSAISNSDRFPVILGTGVRMNFANETLGVADGCTRARTAETLFARSDERQYPTFYEIVANAEAATINFKDTDGTLLATEAWKVGTAPNYVGNITLTQASDPAKVMAPKWSMNGSDTVTEALGGTVVDATYTLVPTQKAFEVTVDGTTTYVIDTAYETLYRYVTGMTVAAKIKLYTNYVIPNSTQSLAFKQAGTELDLNGKTIETEWKYNGGIIAANATLWVYSSAEGAELLATAPTNKENVALGKGGGFILAAAGDTLTVGKDKSGTAYPKNLTAKGTCLLGVSAGAVLDGITYVHTVNDNWGLIQYWKTANVIVNDCDFDIGIQLFAARSGDGSWTATVTGSRIYTTSNLLTRAHNEVKGKTAGSITLIATDIYSTQELKNEEFANTTPAVALPVLLGDDVRMNRTNTVFALKNPDAFTRARIDETTFSLNGKTASVLYTVTAKINTVPVTFKNGNTVLTTETWAVKNTPKYNETITLTEGNPESDTVKAPSGRWLIDGKNDPLTAEQVAAGETLIAVAEFVDTPKAFQATINGTTYYFTDTEFETLCDYVSGLTAPAKIRLYTDYVVPPDRALVFSQAGSELDLNGKTLETVYKLKRGFVQSFEELYVYSTAPGAELLATAANKGDEKNGGGFIFTAYSKAKLVVGRAKDSDTTVYPMTAKGTCLVVVGDNDTTVELNGVTYVQSVADNVGYLQYNGTNNAITVNNCDFWLTLDSAWHGLFGFRRGTGGWKATVNDSRIYIAGTQQLTYVHSDMKKDGAITVTPKGATFTNTVIYAANSLTNNATFPITFGEGVKMNKVYNFPLTDGYVTARIDETKEILNGEDVTLLYEVVAKENAFEATFKVGSTSVKETWKKDSKPTYRANVFGSNEESTYYWYAAATAGITENTDYTAKLKTTESKITGNLTLYANITFNLYFRADGFIKGVKYKGNTTLFSETVPLNGVEYYAFKINDISPKDLSEAFTLEVILENGETTATYTVNTSLSKYAASILADKATDEKTEAGKTLVKALLDYVYEVSVEPTLGNKDADSEGLAAIKKGLDYYGRDRKTWNGTGTIPAPGNITAAGLKLASTPGFIFFLSSDYAGTNEIKVTVNGTETSYTVTHDGDNHYFIVSNIHVSKYTEDLMLTLDGKTFVYNLDAYMQGFIENEEAIPAYANALYTYVLAAQNYLKYAAN